MNEKLFLRLSGLGVLIIAALLVAGCGGGVATSGMTQPATAPTPAPIDHYVDLHWAASASPVSGYNVYRGTQSGGPYMSLNSALIPTAAYTDGEVVSGLTYYYVTTAVDSSGIESVRSNETVAVIPIS